MSVVTISVMLRNGEALTIQEPVSPDQCRRLLALNEGVRIRAEDEVLQQNQQIEGWGARAIRQWSLMIDESGDLPAGTTRVRTASEGQLVWENPPKRRLGFCFSFLSVAVNVLPRPDRQEALDEWADELRCAAEERLPILRRTASILVRALPPMALRGRVLSRARRWS